jgi:hypothetical protein
VSSGVNGNARPADEPSFNWPTTWPASLMPVATALAPPRVPRSLIAPLRQMNARDPPAARSTFPTIWPEALMSDG